MSAVLLNQSQARAIVLHAAGLTKRGQFGRGKEAVYKMIEHLGFVQIDTNFVVERAHHHSIFARVPDYENGWVDELQSEGRVFEFWTFATGYIPMHDFRFSFPVKEAFLSHRAPLTPVEANLMRKILDKIEREGPQMARSFENDRVKKSTGWWDWRPSKLALERLHLEGKLITTRTKNFQKIYDLTENVIPRDIDLTPPDQTEFTRHVIERGLRCFGLAFVKDLVYISRYTKIPLKNELQKMVEEGIVIEVTVEGVKDTMYMSRDYLKKKIKLTGDVFILSPFDILNVFRHRLRQLFDFDYQVECFVPKPKRKYGYFSLPILIGDKFIARMDSKADRKTGILNVLNLHFEDIALKKADVMKLGEALSEYAEFNQCKSVSFAKSNDKKVVLQLKKILDNLKA